MDNGRRDLYHQNHNEAEPYQSPMEDGMVHHHEFIFRHLEPLLGAK
ncbi:MAG: hypothetical protein K8H84_06165 [Sulfuricella denitrificans]|nr:hypothetical protein [Sulfuricella denitrificans]